MVSIVDSALTSRQNVGRSPAQTLSLCRRMPPSPSPRPRTQPQAPGDGVIVLTDGGILLPSILSPRSRVKRRQSRLSPPGSGGGTSPQLARASTSPLQAEQPQPPVAESLLELGRVLSLQRQGLSTLLQLHQRQSLSPHKHAASVETRFGTDSCGQRSLRRLCLAPEHASGCPRRRPAPANQPLGPRWHLGHIRLVLT